MKNHSVKRPGRATGTSNRWCDRNYPVAVTRSRRADSYARSVILSACRLPDHRLGPERQCSVIDEPHSPRGVRSGAYSKNGLPRLANCIR